MFFVFLVGTAGSGKSLLTAALEKWLTETKLSVALLNLDPGVEDTPYTSDIDIREYVDYDKVVTNFSLGPNGALVASLDMAVSYMHDLREEAEDTQADYIIVDCPGQMELFAYRNSGPLMVKGLKGQDPAVSLYLLDSNIARAPEGYLSSMLLGLSISIRFGLPQLNLLSKSDILGEEKVEEIVEWSTETYKLEEALTDAGEGLTREFAEAILRMLDDLGGATEVLPVSAKTLQGVDTLYGEMQRILMGGDNIEK
ncbi:MAG: ATP/GTP-binding protein [Candidatus Thorarchaeota archaeon]|nr:ATP/GTP-binding protein [Candidatus Thorarchaeota archaeon]